MSLCNAHEILSLTHAARRGPETRGREYKALGHVASGKKGWALRGVAVRIARRERYDSYERHCRRHSAHSTQNVPARTYLFRMADSPACHVVCLLKCEALLTATTEPLTFLTCFGWAGASLCIVRLIDRLDGAALLGGHAKSPDVVLLAQLSSAQF